MEIHSSFRDRIFECYDKGKTKAIENAKLSHDEHVEIEAVVRQRKINKANFTALLKYFLSVGLRYAPQEDTLNVVFEYDQKDYRFSIMGQQNISEYCKTNKVTLIGGELITKNLVKFVNIDDYDVKLNVKTEEKVVGERNDILGRLHAIKKYFRFIKRYSFTSEDGQFRYDLSIVKDTPFGEKHLNLVSSGLFQSAEHYEVEIEYLNPEGAGTSWPSKEAFVKALFANVFLVLRVLDDDDYLLPAPKKADVLDQYCVLCKFPKPKDSGKRTPFVGPMPITLEMRNLGVPSLGTQSILQDYTVTDKADGERVLLFFDREGKGYTIDRNLKVKYTGIHSDTLRQTLLDGEYLTRSVTGKSQKRFMCFDIYFHAGESVAGLPLLDEKEDCRVKRMERVCQMKFGGDPEFTVEAKEFYTGTEKMFKGTGSIFAASKYVLDLFLNKDKKNYKIDGLIFTPRTLAVGTSSPGMEPRLGGGSWVKVFKWKPINTIDFLVKTEKNDQGKDLPPIKIDGEWNKQVRLFVGYNARAVERITPHAYLYKQVPKENVYADRAFVPPKEYDNISKATIPMKGAFMVLPETGEVIGDNTVVEFYWDDAKYKWVPLLARKDKYAGNDYATALNVWRSIKNPITTKMMTDDKTPDAIVDMEDEDTDLYYNRTDNRNDSASKAMNEFHNWVKHACLIERFADKSFVSVFDIACGKMGDMMKYCKADFKTIVGIDKSVDNITNAKDGAYSRLLSNLKQPWNAKYEKNKYAFLPMDASKVLDAAYISKMEDKDTQEIANVLWGNKSVPALSPYHGIVKERFDLVSCQFAIHYFFEDKGVLRSLLTNVDALIKEGGYFIGTCLDGVSVDKKFRSQGVSKGQALTGTKHDRVMWRLEKGYETFDLENEDNNFGTEISVYMETIGKVFKEYLVDYRLLEKELASFQLRPLNERECKRFGIQSSTGLFKGAYEGMLRTSKRPKQDIELSPAEQEYSFLNRWFIFRKDTGGADKPDKPDKPDKLPAPVAQPPAPAKRVVKPKK